MKHQLCAGHHVTCCAHTAASQYPSTFHRGFYYPCFTKEQTEHTEVNMTHPSSLSYQVVETEPRAAWLLNPCSLH